MIWRIDSISFFKICLDLLLFSCDKLKKVIASLLNVSSETFPFLSRSLYQSRVSLLVGCSWCCSFECPIITEFRDTCIQETNMLKYAETFTEICWTFTETFTFHQNCVDRIPDYTMWLFEQVHFQCIFGYKLTALHHFCFGITWNVVGILTRWWVNYQQMVGFLTSGWKSTPGRWISNHV